ncbi:hypothetical protein [Streptomyces sclerotialus]|uniref:hypothetical protein n=1 Tax=Streptomyces sclerotialus TaxID=1957 RepID=UPI0018C9EC76
MGRQYAKLSLDTPDAVSAGLDAARHPGSTAYEEHQRTRGRELHVLREKLRDDDRCADEQYEALKGPSGHSGWLRLAANHTAAADLQDALAGVYEELLTAEPSLAEEHRASAEQYRAYPQNAQNVRKYVELALKRTGRTPARSGERVRRVTGPRPGAAIGSGGMQRLQQQAAWVRAEHRVLTSVMAGPVAHHPTLGPPEEGRVAREEIPVQLPRSRPWSGEVGQAVPDRLQDLQDVLADQLHHERGGPRFAGAEDLLQVTLADPPVPVARVQAVQDQPLGRRERALRTGDRLVVVDPVRDGDRLPGHLDPERPYVRVPTSRHHRQDVPHLIGQRGGNAAVRTPSISAVVRSCIPGA